MTTTDVEKEIIDRITDLLTSLNATRITFQEWSAKQDPALATEHQAWQVSKRKAFLRDAAAVAEYDSKDPYLQSLSEVKLAKAEVTRVENELALGKAELKALYDAGTPRDKYRNLIEAGQNAVTSIKQNVRQLRVETVLRDLYHTSNVSRLPESCVDAAKLNPLVVQVDMLHFSPLLTDGHDSDLALENAYTRIVDALSKLRSLMVESPEPATE